MPLNLTNSSDTHVSCSITLDNVRPKVLSVLNTSCGVPADLIELTLDHHNETEPCPAQLRIFHLLGEGFTLSTIKKCLESKQPLAMLGLSAGQPLSLGNVVPVSLVEAITIPFAFLSVIVLCMAAQIVWKRCFRWRFITNFLSYRVDSDQELVQELYKRLTALGLSVWWDKECLKPGQPWEEGFADGLFASKVLIPVLSKGALANFSSLNADSPCDNVLLEHMLALEQKERGLMKAIFPVFVGQIDPSTNEYGNFFRNNGIPGCSSELNVTAIDAKAQEHLERKHGDNTLKVTNRTPKGVLNQLCRHQGDFVQGDRDEALNRIALAILAMNKDVAAGKVIAVATEGGGSKSDAPANDEGTKEGFLSWLLHVLHLQGTGVSSSPETSDAELLPGTARSEGFERFFSPAIVGESSDAESNPVLAYEAKAERNQRESMIKGKRGRLSRLLPPPGAKADFSQEEEIEMYLRLQGVKTEKVQVAPTSPMALNLQLVQITQEHKQRQSIASRDASRRARSRIMPSRGSEFDRDLQQSSARDSIMPTLASMLKSVRSQRISTRLSARLPSSRRASVPDGAWSADGNAEGGRQLQRSSQAAADGHGNRERC